MNTSKNMTCAMNNLDAIEKTIMAIQYRLDSGHPIPSEWLMRKADLMRGHTASVINICDAEAMAADRFNDEHLAQIPESIPAPTATQSQMGIVARSDNLILIGKVEVPKSPDNHCA